MSYALVVDGAVTPLNARTPIRSEDGRQHPASILERWTEQDLNAIGIYRIERDPAPVDQVLVRRELRLDGEVVRDAAVTRPLSVAELKGRARAERDLRRAISPVELDRPSGAVLLRVASDESDVSALLALADAVEKQLLPEPFRFKAGGLFFDLTHAEFAQVSTVVRQRIYGLYEVESACQDGIMSGAITTPSQIVATFDAVFPS